MTAMGTNKLVDREGLNRDFYILWFYELILSSGGGGRWFLAQEDFELPRLCTPYFIYIWNR